MLIFKIELKTIQSIDELMIFFHKHLENKVLTTNKHVKMNQTDMSVTQRVCFGARTTAAAEVINCTLPSGRPVCWTLSAAVFWGDSRKYSSRTLPV